MKFIWFLLLRVDFQCFEYCGIVYVEFVYLINKVGILVIAEGFLEL